MRKFLLISTVVLSLSIAFNGCSRFRDRDQVPLVIEEPVEAGAVDQYETQLRDMLGRRITQIEHSRDEDKERVLYRSPYYYKEYSTYTESAQDADVDIREADSRACPYEGKAEVAKIRYTTQMHRNRSDAARDDSFVRQTGNEILNYELRNGRWKRVGGIFVVDTAEEYVNGAWVPVQEERAEDLMKEPEIKRGFFGNMWDRVSGK